jgi:hypothetical protein
MSHLIQTIDIEGTRYCPKNHDGRMTDAVKTSYTFGGGDANSADVSGITKLLMVMPAGKFKAVGEVSFGVTCATQLFPVNFYAVDTSSVEDYFIDIYLTINGDNFQSFASIYNETVGDESESIGNLIDLSNVPCGNIVTLTVYAARPHFYVDPETGNGELTLTFEILGVS